MTAIVDSAMTGVSAWIGAEMRQSDDWIYILNAAERAELDQALKAVQNQNLAMTDITRETFPLSVLGGVLSTLEQDVRTGRGFYLLCGIPLDRYSDDEAALITWGLGTHLGTAISQNAYGDMLGRVFDHGYVEPTAQRVRGYQTREALMLHVDRCDMTTLLCLRQAQEGGLSRLISSMTIHNGIRAQNPAYLEPLYAGVPYIHREAAGDMHSWVEPVYSVADGVLSCSLRRNTVQQAIEQSGLPVSQLTLDALACFDQLAENPDLYLEMEMQPGDLQLVNNYTVLHGRTAFVDYEEPDKKRELLRLWLRFFTPRPVADYLKTQFAGVKPAAELATQKKGGC